MTVHSKCEGLSVCVLCHFWVEYFGELGVFWAERIFFKVDEWLILWCFLYIETGENKIYWMEYNILGLKILEEISYFGVNYRKVIREHLVLF